MKKHVRKLRTLLSIFLIVAIVAGSLSGYLVMTHQAEAAVNDQIANASNSGTSNNDTGNDNNTDEGGSGTDGSGSSPSAVMSSSVKVFTGDEAQQINNSITSIACENKLVTIKFDKSVNDSIKSLGIGDVFYLDGNSSTPFTEVYIGKVSSTSDNGSEYTIISDSPTIDEVFDELYMDFSTALTSDRLVSSETPEGVVIKQVDSIDSYFDKTATESDFSTPSLSTLQCNSTTESKFQTVAEEGHGTDLLFEVDLDLAKAYNLLTNKIEKADEKDPYRKEVAPVAKLTGEVGVKNLQFDTLIDWNSQTYGFRNLAFGVRGKIVADTKFELGVEGEIGGNHTEKNIFNAVKFEALDEKMFPIFLVTYDIATVMTWTFPSNSQIEAITSVAPLTVAFACYVDLSGNFSIKSTLEFSYTNEFDGSVTFIRDGKWNVEKEFNHNDHTDWSFEAEAKVDADTHIGASVLLYLFNLNIVDLAIAKFGLEVEGKASVKVDSNNTDPLEGASASGHIRLYLKLGDIKAKLKVKVELLGGVINGGGGFDWNFTIADLTLWELGTRKNTSYSDKMSYQSMTAQDGDAIYYKDTSGFLVKEDPDGFRTILFADEFFSICGIDKSYIYILRPNGGNYDIYRVDKEEQDVCKKIVSSITTCLMMDSDYIYYVPVFDNKTIERIDRETLKTAKFSSFEQSVQLMSSQGGGFYITAANTDALSWFFGATTYYYLIDTNGKIVKEYGSSPDIPDLKLDYYSSGYYTASKMASSGYLRNTCYETYWLSPNKSTNVLTECASGTGWNPTEVGIFTTVDNPDGNTPYKIVLYKAGNGQRVDVTEVTNGCAFFTLCQSTDGTWYFYDQTDTELTLYKMNSDFTGKTVIKTFSLDEISYNLTDCGMQIMNNRLYFYTMPDGQASYVLYRYDLY